MPHEATSASLITLAGGSSATGRLRVSSAQPMRRLYLGAVFVGSADAVNWLWTVSVRFLGVDPRRAGGRLVYACRQLGGSYTNAAVPFGVVDNVPNVPPHSVEIVANASAAQFASAAPELADEMLLQINDQAASRTLMIRMGPIPVFSACDEIELEWKAACASGGEYFYGVAGCRSSEVAL